LKLELTLFEKYYIKEFKEDDKENFQGWRFIYFISKPFRFRWFTDCGDWFLYIHCGKRYWRFSSAGYVSSKEENQ